MPLSTSSHSGTSPTSLWGHEMKAPPLELWSKGDWHQRAEEWLQVEIAKRDSPSPEPLEITHMVALPLGFERVTAGLQGDPSPVAALKVPLEFTLPEVAIKPAVATMCASHVIQDEACEVTYMETVTTSIGWVALRHIHPVTQNPWLTIEDITDLPIEGNNDCL